jgi:hypothetical protein
MAMINTKFSSSFRRHVLAHELARGAVLTMALAQAWDRFLFVFIQTFQTIKKFSFEKDPANDKRQEREHGTYCNPQTDFRVLGVQVFTDHIGKKYQQIMSGFHCSTSDIPLGSRCPCCRCGAVCGVINGLKRGEDLSKCPCTLATIECPACCDHCLERYLPATRGCIEYLINTVDVNTCFVGFVGQPQKLTKWVLIMCQDTSGSLFDNRNLPLIKPPADHLVWRSVINF